MIKHRPITVAYLILAHTAPDQLAKLVAALPADSPIMIHFDRRANHADYKRAIELLAERPHLKFVERHRCYWGDLGIVQGTISLIRELISSKVNFDYATLLSGSDYPIKSHDEIALYLHQNDGSEFIESFSLTKTNRWSDHGGLFKTPEKVLCRHLRFRSRVFRLPGLRKMPYQLQPYGGSQWWTLSSEALHYIIEFIQKHRGFTSFSKYVFIPDEFFIQTILSNSYLAARIRGDDLRYAIWDRPSPPYPAILTSKDLDALLGSSKLFGRKFNIAVDAAVFDALDYHNNNNRS